ncbi:hypothetical protein [Amycolatopsis sp. CA-230715]|uniref:hypothetical protein n=1 Tax=Amycolatopsis sp. CA-230715 TaxID=2745196 RepID=UPI001C021844|nr:hypothetical protein [Amycolatopsis sp. CA-230715]QWF85688.1 hypothetical protein HUW46_09168 [Amycolatopsis sp. CA-230715]
MNDREKSLLDELPHERRGRGLWIVCGYVVSETDGRWQVQKILTLDRYCRTMKFDTFVQALEWISNQLENPDDVPENTEPLGPPRRDLPSPHTVFDPPRRVRGQMVETGEWFIGECVEMHRVDDVWQLLNGDGDSQQPQLHVLETVDGEVLTVSKVEVFPSNS